MNKASGWTAVAEYYGLHHQLIKLCEETGELMEAVNSVQKPQSIMSEIADVCAMIEQVDWLIGDRTGELEDMVERIAQENKNEMFGSCCATVITQAARMANYDTDKRSLVEPMAHLLCCLRRWVNRAGEEAFVREEKARKLKRQQRRIREEQALHEKRN